MSPRKLLPLILRLKKSSSAQSFSEESERTVSYFRAQLYIADEKHRDAVKLLTNIRAQDELPEIWREKLFNCYETLGEKRKAEALIAELR